MLEFLYGKEKEQNIVIEKLSKESEEAVILMTISGIAYHNALLIMSEIGEVKRFATGTEFCGYCGLVPMAHISDKTVHYGQMTQVGNKKSS